MGVTKKKAYLKPEMERFEMKMEAAFMSASRAVIEEGDTVDFVCVTIFNNNWLENNGSNVSGGAWSFIKEGTEAAYETGVTTRCQNLPPEVYKAGFNENDCVTVKRLDKSCDGNEYTGGGNGPISVSVTLVKKGGCN